VAKDIAMHVAAVNPMVINPDDVDPEVIEKEKEIFAAQSENSGKPAEIIEKMIGGRIRKYLAEISLVEQPFVKNPDQTVGQLAKEAGETITGMVRFEVGEGIEKEEVDFAEEVMAQARGN
jgi:translation elongation factor Ts